MKQTETSLAVAPKKAAVFVSGFTPTTTPEEVKNHVEAYIGCQDGVCEKLVTRADSTRSSFKIQVKAEDREKIMDGAVWPAGIVVDHFRLPRRSRDPRQIV